MSLVPVYKPHTSLFNGAYRPESNGATIRSCPLPSAHGLRSSIKRRTLKDLFYLLDNGADVSQVDASLFFNDEDLLAKPSLEAMEMLVAHGWDIDTRRCHTDWPLLWSVARFHDIVEWCLDHGASVYLPGDTPPRNANGTSQVPRIILLEAAARFGSVTTFKLLREKGAPFHRGVLHIAVEQAACEAPRINDSASPSASNGYFNKRMEMVRYLVDEVGIDVNAEWWRPGQSGATPLDRVAHHFGGHRDVRELVWFLLDRSANPNHASVLDYNKGQYVGTGVSYLSPLAVAQRSFVKHLLEAIQQWQEQQGNNMA
ncbi:hypothetical protein ACQKWADRAFT_325270 [Trichoderma austrokoningii]